ncbi:M23 family metallopeptidase [Synechococcus sp. PCC 7335]|uniref:M23 family metallopeptidase n=1 Tax=Synechococcus sp. (strain ATCC 29403 / PCC 7335) TaxID=91464 RepID=UPI000A0519CF|nr:M23 family metallopeptidase [Synechococcus sp. PCC 7335]
MKRHFLASLCSNWRPFSGRWLSVQRFSRRRKAILSSLLLAIGVLLAGAGELVPQTLRQAAVAVPDAQIARASEPWQIASFPVENFQAYTSPYGYRDSGFHYGIDIAAPTGSYIRNWWEGHVVEVSDDSACGTSVVISSGDWTHIYCHMQGYVKKERGRKVFLDGPGGVRLVEGQQLYTGDRIGRVGMTGRTTGPHLHWGMRYQDDWVDPGLVLQAMADGQR